MELTFRSPFSYGISNSSKSLSRRFADIIKGRTAIAYDPQDLTTLFQDAQGTLPVYRPGTGLVDPPVGLMLDKGQGVEVSSANVTPNGDFTASTGWSFASGWSIANGTASATATMEALYRGDVFVGRYYEVTYTILNYVSGSVKLFAGTSSSPTVRSANGTYTERLFCSGTPQTRVHPVTSFTGSIDNISVREIKGYHAYQTTTTARPALSGRYNLLTATETLSTQSVTTVATNYTLSFSGAGTVTLSGTATGTLSAGTHTITCTAGTLTCTVAGSVTKADLRAANDGVGLAPYQRVDSATTYDTAGFPLYLKFDGVDDFLQTANVDLTGTDEITIGAGSQRFGGVNYSRVYELSADISTSNGSFIMMSPELVASNNVMFSMKGTTNPAPLLFANNTVSAKLASVFCGKISADSYRVSINGAAYVARAGDLGTGNFSNSALYIGARGLGPWYFFSGRIYSLCILGALLSTSEQAVLERYLNAKTRAY